VASASDYIFATELSDVGSIGVTMSYLDNSTYNQKEGYVYNSLSTGKFKDILNPEKQLTWEERRLLERDLEIIHDIFVKSVAANRGMEVGEANGLADGSSMLGEMALEAGLIDEVGGYYEIQNYLLNLIGEEPVICW
jgi:protease-4